VPAVSEKQRRLFAIAEHHPDQLHAKNRGLARLPRQTLHEFASTVMGKAKRKLRHGRYARLSR